MVESCKLFLFRLFLSLMTCLSLNYSFDLSLKIFSVDVLDKWAEYKIIGKYTTEVSAATELYNTGKNIF